MGKRRDIERTLERAGLPRAKFIGTEREPRWTFGFGTSEAMGQVTVWCNPGGPSREAWHRSASLADRVDQCLTIAGYSTYRDRDRDTQQILIMGGPHPAARITDPHRRILNRSRAAAASSILLLLVYPLVGGSGAVLAAVICLVAALVLGIEYEMRHRRDSLAALRKGTTAS